jgi:hypothetical protein
MAIIVDRIYNNLVDPDLRLSLLNEQIARPINIGSNWQWIRVGLRLCQSGSGIPGEGANFAVGLTAGSASLYADPQCHFVGQDLNPISAWNGDIAGRNVNWAGGAGLPRTSPIGGGRIIVRVSGSMTYNATSGSEKLWAIGGTQFQSASHIRDYFMLDFVKGQGDPSMWQIVWTYNSVPFLDSDKFDTSNVTFHDNMTFLTASISYAPGLFPDFVVPYTQSVIHLPVSESIHGYLDTVNIYWSSSNIPMEISDIAVCQFF